MRIDMFIERSVALSLKKKKKALFPKKWLQAMATSPFRYIGSLALYLQMIT